MLTFRFDTPARPAPGPPRPPPKPPRPPAPPRPRCGTAPNVFTNRMLTSSRSLVVVDTVWKFCCLPAWLGSGKSASSFSAAGSRRRGRNLVVGKRLAGRRIDHRPAESRQIAGAFGQRRHVRVGVVRIARVIAGVVHEEERARAVDDVRNHERTAERRAEALLEVVGLHRRLTVERERRRVERRRVDALKRAAANLVAAPAAPAERAAEPAASAAESAGPARSAATAGGLPAPPAPTRALSPPPRPLPKRSAKSPGPLGPKKPSFGLRRADRRHRFGRRVRRESRRQQHRRRRIVRVGAAVVLAREPASIGEQLEALELLPRAPDRGPSAAARPHPGVRRRGAARPDLGARRWRHRAAPPARQRPRASAAAGRARATPASSSDRRAADSSPRRRSSRARSARTRRTRPSACSVPAPGIFSA